MAGKDAGGTHSFPMPYVFSKGLRQPLARDIYKSKKHRIVGLLPIVFLAFSLLGSNFQNDKPAPQQARHRRLRCALGSHYLCPMLQGLGVFYLCPLRTSMRRSSPDLHIPKQTPEERNQCFILNSQFPKLFDIVFSTQKDSILNWTKKGTKTGVSPSQQSMPVRAVWGTQSIVTTGLQYLSPGSFINSEVIPNTV